MNSIHLKIYSVNKKCLNLYTQFVINLLKNFQVKYKIAFLPKKKKYITFLKSPHVNKRAQEHFCLIKHQILIIIKDLNLLKILLSNKPASIQLKIKIQRG